MYFAENAYLLVDFVCNADLLIEFIFKLFYVFALLRIYGLICYLGVSAVVEGQGNAFVMVCWFKGLFQD